MITNMMLEFARFYALLDLPVIPLQQGNKQPHTSHGVRDASKDVDQVKSWWARWPNANVGIATGKGIDVIDLDGWEARATFSEMIEQDHDLEEMIIGAVNTPRHGGLHLYVHSTGRNNSTPWPNTKIDYRGNGGYVVAPPSRLIVTDDRGYAGEYQWAMMLDFSRPKIIPKAFAPKVTDHDGWETIFSDHGSNAYGHKALLAECESVEHAPKGERNHALNRAAYNLGQLTPHILDHETAHDHLYRAAKRNGLPQNEIKRTISGGLRAGSANPRYRR